MLKKLFKRIKDYFWRNETFITGHISLGRLTMYGRNAMHWGILFHTKKYGYICFRLPLPCYGRWWPLYLYFSPNATPWAATFMLGRKHHQNDWMLSRIRRKVLGHNFEVHQWLPEYGCENYNILYAINNSVGQYRSSYSKKARETYLKNLQED